MNLRSQPSGDSDFSRKISRSSVKKPPRTGISGILKHSHTKPSIITEDSMKIIEVDTSMVEKEFFKARAENPKYDIDDIVLKKIDFARDEK